MLHLCNKNECDEREEVSHAHCAKFVYHNTNKSFLRAFFQKSENFYLCNFSYKSKFETKKEGSPLLLLFKSMYKTIDVGRANITADYLVAINENININLTIVVGIICHGVSITHNVFLFK